jgi:DNA-directed RNA polymerase subunit RPC12/RpoP
MRAPALTPDHANPDLDKHELRTASAMTFKCPKCSALITADPADAGREGECPTCGVAMLIPRLELSPTPPPLVAPSPAPFAVPHPQLPQQPKPVDTLIRAGWICFGIGAGIMPFLLIVPIWSPLFTASFIIGIIVMVKGRQGAGLALLLSSIVVPFAIAGTVILLGIGAMAGMAEAMLPKAHPRQLRTVARPTPLPIPAETITLDSFLSQMATCAQEIKDAETTVRRDEIMKQAQDRAAQLCQNHALTFRAVIKDVSTPQPGVTRLEYRMTAPTAPIGSPRLEVDTAGHVDLNLTRDKALKLVPGQTIQITGAVRLASDSTPFTGSQHALQIGLRLPSAPYTFGRLVLPSYRCTIVPSTPKP